MFPFASLRSRWLCPVLVNVCPELLPRLPALERPLAAGFRPLLTGVADQLRLLGGDATLERFGSLGWRAHKLAVEDASPYLEQL